MNVVGKVEGTTCIIVDDMIDTGGTLVKAAETLMEAGAKSVVACCTHAVFSGNAIERLKASQLREVIVSDTIPVPQAEDFPRLTVLSVAPLFGEAIRRIHSDDSISSLFR
jgi:ribose-phosphate pyrophosphokinase